MAALPRYVMYERDEQGSVYAIEMVDAERWDDALLEPPSPELSDVRVVRLSTGSPPPDLPRWLGVEARVRRAAETPALYVAGDMLSTPIGRSLWPWSPHFREAGSTLAEFISAGSEAVSHPDRAPTEARHQLDLVAGFASGREPPIAQIAVLRAEALERWLRCSFGDPDHFAEALLLQRIREGDAPATWEALRFLAEGHVPDDTQEYAELAVDRDVLREQASPWRYLEGAPFAGPLSAVQAWRGRYRSAYDAHYRNVAHRAEELRKRLSACGHAAAALERLDGIRSLGPPAGRTALERYHAAISALNALPERSDGRSAQTAAVVLGQDPSAFGPAVAAEEAVARALEVQRQRLGSGTVRAVLDRQGVPALDRLLQAITASGVDGIERVLNDRLATHIELLLNGAAESPLGEVAARHPTVTAETLDDAVATFRELLEASIAAADDRRVVLREDRVGSGR